MVFRLTARNRATLERIEAAVQNAQASAETLQKLLADYGALAERRAELKQLEHKGDRLTREIHDATRRRSGAGREAVRDLASSVDDVVDSLYDAGNRLFLFDIPKPPEMMKRFADVVVAQTRALTKAVGDLRTRKTWPSSLKHCVEVHTLENDADRLFNDATARLFRGKDAVEIMKFKEIYELLEHATDRCDDATDAIRDLIGIG